MDGPDAVQDGVRRPSVGPVHSPLGRETFVGIVHGLVEVIREVRPVPGRPTGLDVQLDIRRERIGRTGLHSLSCFFFPALSQERKNDKLSNEANTVEDYRKVVLAMC